MNCVIAGVFYAITQSSNDNYCLNLGSEDVTLLDYMKMKYGNRNVKVLGNTESKILNIELTRGWFKRNKDRILTQEEVNKLYEYTSRSASIPDKRKERFRALIKEYSDWTGQFVYLMRNEIGRTKIGISEDPIRRCKNITTASGLFTELLAYWSVDKIATEVEKLLLEHYSEFKTYGEWFNTDQISVKSVENIMDSFTNYERITIDSQSNTM